MVEIFKTNVHREKRGKRIVAHLSKKFPELKINFDLEDCDRILRIEGDYFKAKKISRSVKKFGHECKILE